jgi:peptidoglycan/xylan/chitin deacetylase (PgdA/CDA1 family)
MDTCLVVMYHYVRDSGATAFPDIRALTPELFDRQLEWLQSHYTVVDLRTFEAALDGRAPLPPNAALLTFDDGFVDHYETVLPRLRARGLQGTFFLTEDACGDRPRLLAVHKMHFLLARLGVEAFGRAVLGACAPSALPAGASLEVLGLDRWDDAGARAIKTLVSHELPFGEADRVLEELFAERIGDSAAFARTLYLDAAMVREMAAAGMTFGYHTRSHRLLARLSPEEQRRELGSGVAWIRALTGQATVSFCYPWGGPRTYTGDTVRILRESGYSAAFNTVRRRASAGDDNRYELPRIDTRDLPPYTTSEPAHAPAFSTEDA